MERSREVIPVLLPKIQGFEAPRPREPRPVSRPSRKAFFSRRGGKKLLNEIQLRKDVSYTSFDLSSLYLDCSSFFNGSSSARNICVCNHILIDSGRKVPSKYESWDKLGTSSLLMFRSGNCNLECEGAAISFPDFSRVILMIGVVSWHSSSFASASTSGTFAAAV